METTKTKNERIAALDEKIEGLHAHLASLAAEHDGEIAMLRVHCGIPRPDAPPADPAPVPLTACSVCGNPKDEQTACPECGAIPCPDLLAARKASAALAVGDSRVQPAADYVAGQAVVTPDGLATYGAVEDEEHHLVCMPWCEVRSYKALRPCPAGAGCVVMDRQTGEYGICFAAGSGLDVSFRKIVDCFDPARHAVMLVPRQPAAPAEQPGRQCFFAPYEDCQCQGECCEGLPKRVTPTCEGTPVPAEQPVRMTPGAATVEDAQRVSAAMLAATLPTAEQPDPAADLRREIDAALGKVWQPLGDVDTESKLFALADKLTGIIEAAAAVPPVARPGDVESYAYDIGYNAGQNSILAPMLAALTQGGK